MATMKLIRGNGSNLTWSVPLLGVFTNGDASGNLTSDWCQAADRHIALQLLWTGTTSGSFTVELSNDGANVAYTLTDADFSPAPLSNASGGAGGTAASFDTNYVFFRVKFAVVSGSGTLTGVVNMKR